MVLSRPGPAETHPLCLRELPLPEPETGEIRIRVLFCGVCRTDLHVIEGELPPVRTDVIPGHEVIGRVDACGPGASRFREGDLVGAAWLYASCGRCPYCRRGDENLCNAPLFTGYTANGGYAEYLNAREQFVYPLSPDLEKPEAAPFLCAGIIGYRALRRSEVKPGDPIGLYGFGGSAHLVIQVARHEGCPVYVCTREAGHRDLARKLGAVWVGPTDAIPPVKLRSAILFAPAGELVLPALDALDRGGTLAVAGIYLSPIPAMDYDRYLFQERTLRSVTANTRQDGEELLKLAAAIPLQSQVEEYPLEQANEALIALNEGRINGAAVLRLAPLTPTIP